MTTFLSETSLDLAISFLTRQFTLNSNHLWETNLSKVIALYALTKFEWDSKLKSPSFTIDKFNRRIIEHIENDTWSYKSCFSKGIIEYDKNSNVNTHHWKIKLLCYAKMSWYVKSRRTLLVFSLNVLK